MVVTGFSNRLVKTALSSLPAGDFLAAGFASSIGKKLEPGTLLLPDRLLSPQGDQLRPDVTLRSALIDALLSENLPFREGPLFTAGENDASPDEAVAVDGESYGLIEYLTAVGRRAAALRFVSNRADDEAEEGYRDFLEAHAAEFSSILARVAKRLNIAND